jgi:hypothetical protein
MGSAVRGLSVLASLPRAELHDSGEFDEVMLDDVEHVVGTLQRVAQEMGRPLRRSGVLRNGCTVETEVGDVWTSWRDRFEQTVRSAQSIARASGQPAGMVVEDLLRVDGWVIGRTVKSPAWMRGHVEMTRKQFSRMVEVELCHERSLLETK